MYIKTLMDHYHETGLSATRIQIVKTKTKSQLKGTLMQIWKSPHMFVFIQKCYPENFAFLILGILELYSRKVCEMFVNKHTETTDYVKN